MTEDWVPGNSISLLENGDEFFPRVLEAIEAAQQEIFIETFILCDDAVGREFQRALTEAASRGVWISVMVDGWGSYYLPQHYIDDMLEAGISFHLYEPGPRWVRNRLNIFRRMHRKLVVVDGETAFIAGINLAHNHMTEYGADYKQDYGAQLRGPIVTKIRRFTQNALVDYARRDVELVQLDASDRGSAAQPGDANVLFITRDNNSCRDTIENQYIAMIQKAKHRISIANAYFFPGYRLLKALRDAARRGVRVRLLIQGKPGSPLAKRAARTLYDFLVESEIEVYEYWEHQLHGKIAAIDNEWATVGSSNLDPFSFCLNLEANVFVEDRDFNSAVHGKVHRLIEGSEVRRIDQSWLRRRTLIKWLNSVLVYHFLRHFPLATGWLPRLDPSTAAKPQPTHQARRHGSDNGR